MSTFRDILIFHTQSFVIAPAGHNKGSQPFLWLEQTTTATTNIHRVPLRTRLHIHQMNVIKTSIHGVLIIEPRVFTDTRGYFFESFSQREFDEKVAPILGHKVTFVQDNESKSSYGVMRGLHFQRPPFTQSKLVRCVKGAVLDVAVDIRKGSPTYGQHVAVELTENNHRQFFVPRGFAHGFAVLSETAVFQYKCDEFYHPEADGGISILDESLGIDWRIPTDKAVLSEKDTKHALLKDFDSPFVYREI